MTKQKELWEGQFGDDYTARNVITEQDLMRRNMFWSLVFNSLGKDVIPSSILEIGAGNGINLQAIHMMYDRIKVGVHLDAVEINEKARLSLSNLGTVKNIYPNTECIYKQYEVVFTSGVLIHIHPDNLLKMTKEIYRLSSKYIICAEYFRPEPETKPYRGAADSLFMRDFGGFYLDHFPLQCVSYGFAWKRVTGIDNLTYWIFKKAN